MKQNEKKFLRTGIGFLLAFLLWTALIRCVDVQAAGPDGTEVGFAAFNLWLHKLTGIHMTVYTITDWLGLVPIGVCLCFGAVGLIQMVRRRSLLRVDPDIILLGLYYVLVILAYLVFEMIPISFDRPVWNKHRLVTGMALSILAVAVFIAARQPYAGILFFALLVIKTIGIIKLGVNHEYK